VIPVLAAFLIAFLAGRIVAVIAWRGSFHRLDVAAFYGALACVIAILAGAR
jgi:hypothetical protein